MRANVQQLQSAQMKQSLITHASAARAHAHRQLKNALSRADRDRMTFVEAERSNADNELHQMTSDVREQKQTRLIIYQCSYLQAAINHVYADIRTKLENDRNSVEGSDPEALRNVPTFICDCMNEVRVSINSAQQTLGRVSSEDEVNHIATNILHLPPPSNHYQSFIQSSNAQIKRDLNYCFCV